MAARAEAEHFLAAAFLDDLVEAHIGSTADKENLLGADLDVFLVRMLATALGRDVARRALEDFEQRLLHPFAAHIAGDRDVVGLAPDLVDFGRCTRCRSRRASRRSHWPVKAAKMMFSTSSPT